MHSGWGFGNEASTTSEASFFFLFLPTSSLSISFSRNAQCFPSLAAKCTEPPVRLGPQSADPLSLKTFRGGWIRQASVFPFLEEKGPNSSVRPASLKLATFFFATESKKWKRGWFYGYSLRSVGLFYWWFQERRLPLLASGVHRSDWEVGNKF